jgi:glycosyltransferase involved in cell wall biosynthesis
MKPETFVILIPGFAASESDSTCLPSQQLFVKLLKEKFPGLNVVILAFQYPFIPGKYDWHHCRVIALGGKGRSKLFRLLLWKRIWKILKQLNKENNVIGLLSFWCGECALVGHRFSKKYGTPHYCWIRGQDAKKNNNYVSRIKPSAKELVAVSDFIQNEFETNHGIKPQLVIPNGIDTREFPNENSPRDIDVLGAGSLIQLKQFDLFTNVIGKLKKNIPGISAMVCGKGPEENNLKHLINEYDLHNNLVLPGELSHPELLNRMKRSKIFLHTSNYEGFSAVCIEALYAGAKVISFCKPMKQNIPGWYIVNTKEEMLQMALDILSNNSIEYAPVLPYEMQASVEKIMLLFGK